MQTRKEKAEFHYYELVEKGETVLYGSTVAYTLIGMIDFDFNMEVRHNKRNIKIFTFKRRVR